MKHIILAVAILAAGTAYGQEAKVIRIAPTPSSSVSVAELADSAQKKCVGVSITVNGDKADYLLEAAYKARGTRGLREYTLLSTDGDVLFHTQTYGYDNAMKDVCKYLGRAK